MATIKISRKTVIWAAVSVLALSIIALNTIFVQFGHDLWTFFRHSWPNLIILAVCGFFFYKFYERYTNNGYMRLSDETKSPAPFFIISVAAFILCFAIMPIQSYAGAKGMLNSTEVTEETNAAELSFGERVPYDVAKAVSDRSLGDTSGNSTGIVKSIPTSGEYTTSVIRRGMFQGYESVQTMKLPSYGAANTNTAVKFCKYSDDATLRIGGVAPNNNLAMHIYMRTSPSTKLNAQDAVAVCVPDGTNAEGKAVHTPMLYVPLTKLEGFFSPYRVPAGVAVYNGKTGELTIEKEIENSDLSVYPASVAKDQRESLKASNGLIDYVWQRAGFDDTSKDAEDPNQGNNAEFSMKTNDGDDTFYVTPLTPRGSSSSIVGLSTVDSNTVSNGSLNPLTVHRYDEGTTRDANSTIAATIISTTLEGYKANGLSVFEVVPSEDGTWTASIGKDQSILYRAQIAADGHKVTLIDAAGNERIGNLGDSAPAEGEEITVDNSTDLTGKPIDQMTPEELKDLADQITSELAERALAAQG